MNCVVYMYKMWYGSYPDYIKTNKQKTPLKTTMYNCEILVYMVYN